MDGRDQIQVPVWVETPLGLGLASVAEACLGVEEFGLVAPGSLAQVDAGTIPAVDGLHAASGAELSALEDWLAGNTRRLVLLAGAGAVPAQIARFVGERFCAAPLDRDAFGACLPGAPPAVSARAFTASGGWPEAVLVGDDGDIVPGAALAQFVAWAMGGRLAALLRVVSAMAQGLPPERLADCLDQSTDDLYERLRHAEELGLVVWDGPNAAAASSMVAEAAIPGQDVRRRVLLACARHLDSTSPRDACLARLWAVAPLDAAAHQAVLDVLAAAECAGDLQDLEVVVAAAMSHPDTCELPEVKLAAARLELACGQSGAVMDLPALYESPGPTEALRACLDGRWGEACRAVLETTPHGDLEVGASALVLGACQRIPEAWQQATSPGLSGPVRRCLQVGLRLLEGRFGAAARSLRTLLATDWQVASLLHRSVCLLVACGTASPDCAVLAAALRARAPSDTLDSALAEAALLRWEVVSGQAGAARCRATSFVAAVVDSGWFGLPAVFAADLLDALVLSPALACVCELRGAEAIAPLASVAAACDSRDLALLESLVRELPWPPYIRARLALVTAAVARDAGDSSTAVRHARAALSTFEALDAPVDAAAARRQLEPGARRSPAQDGTLFDLACAGRSNTEIAVELGVSLSSAKRALRRLYESAGVCSREELLNRFGRGQP